MGTDSAKAIALAVFTSALAVAAALGLNGFGALGWHAAVRVTAVMAFLLWWLAFTAGPLARLAPGAFTRTLRARRRGLGLAFATVLAAHGIAILALARREPETISPGPELAFGGLGFALAFAMAATSTDAAVRRIGGRRWRALHLVGHTLLAALFAASYGGRFAEDAAYWPACALLVVALALRPADWIQARLRSSTLPTE
jgi:sulfoxide reductase heme-binding subunit YedZ